MSNDDIQRGTIYLEDLEVGLSRSMTKEIVDNEIKMFAEVSTDRNPVHLDDDYAKGTMFKGRIAHGMMTASFISAVIGEQIPGYGTIYMGQNLKFLAPVRPGEVVTTTVTVTNIDTAKARVTLDCQCTVGDTVVLKGEALVMAPRRN